MVTIIPWNVLVCMHREGREMFVHITNEMDHHRPSVTIIHLVCAHREGREMFVHKTNELDHCPLVTIIPWNVLVCMHREGREMFVHITNEMDHCPSVTIKLT